LCSAAIKYQICALLSRALTSQPSPTTTPYPEILATALSLSDIAADRSAPRFTEADVLENADFVAEQMGGISLGESEFVMTLKQKARGVVKRRSNSGGSLCSMGSSSKVEESVKEAGERIKKAFQGWIGGGGGGGGGGGSSSMMSSRGGNQDEEEEEEEDDDEDDGDEEEEEEEEGSHYTRGRSYSTGSSSRSSSSSSSSLTHDGEGGQEMMMVEEEEDDLDLLGEQAHIPRPVPSTFPSSSPHLPPPLYHSLLVTYNTINACIPSVLPLTLFPLHHLEAALLTTASGLCPPLYLECACQLLLLLLRDRGGSSSSGNTTSTSLVTISTTTTSSNEEEEEEDRPIETLEAVCSCSTSSSSGGGGLEGLLPQSWQEVVRLLIAEREGVTLWDYFDVMGETRRLVEELVTTKVRYWVVVVVSSKRKSSKNGASL